jgi:4,5-dihydroxyphthalate decarboxylase
MRHVPITMALSEYHHTAAIVSGAIPIEGVELTALTLPVEEIFYRFTKFREWHVSEMSFAKYIAMRSRGDDSLVGIPVFPSRVFRHSSIYVRRGEVTAPDQLRDGRLGIPEWGQTAGVYTRGLLAHDYDVPLTSVKWVQAGVNEVGREEKVGLDLPPGISLSTAPDRTLDEMLQEGDLDAVLTAHPPASFEAGSPVVTRLFEDYGAVEREYVARTGVFPIMHLIVIRADIHAAYPWMAANLMTSFERAKRHSIEQLREITASRLPLPWVDAYLEQCRHLLFDGEYWPYGVEPNHTTLEKFAQYAYEQGVARRLMDPTELFPAEVLSTFKI